MQIFKSVKTPVIHNTLEKRKLQYEDGMPSSVVALYALQPALY